MRIALKSELNGFCFTKLAVSKHTSQRPPRKGELRGKCDEITHLLH